MVVKQPVRALRRAVWMAVFVWTCALTDPLGAAQWIRMRSANFELLTSAGEKKGQSLVQYFEQVRRFFVANMKTVDPSDSPRVRIVVFDSKKEFTPFQINEFSPAFFTGGTQGDYIVMLGSAADSYPFAVHEYVHLLIRRSGFRAPLWWHEGLADLYSTLKILGDRIEVGEIPSERSARLALQSTPLDLAAVLGANRNSPIYNDRKTVELFYAQSWALLHMLYLSEPYRPRFADFQAGLSAGASADELFHTIYGKKLQQVHEDLAAYLQQGATVRVQIPLPPRGAAIRIESAAATDLQIQITFANVFMGIEKRRQAAEILDRLSAQYPDSWEVEESLGYLSWSAADRDAARLHFRRAMEKGLGNAAGYVSYASLLGDAGVHAPDIIPLLEKALEIEPSSRDARLRLASMYLSERKYEKMLAILGKMNPFKPEESFQANCLLAYAQAGLGDLPKARKSADDAHPFARTVTEMSEMESLLRTLKQQDLAAAAPAPEAAAAPAGQGVKYTDAANKTPAPVPLEPERTQLKGRLERIDCLGDKLRLIIDVAGKNLALLIVDPNGVTIRGKETGTVAFNCGNQPDTPVAVTFTPTPDSQTGIAGIIRIIEFIKEISSSSPRI